MATSNSNLNGNKLAALPAGIKGLKYLSVVFVDHPPFLGVRPSFFLMCTKHSGLASNAFAEFPVAVLELPKLSDL